MIKYLETLERSVGVASGATLYPPCVENCRLWTLAIDIGRNETADSEAHSLALVGAAGLTRHDTILRGVGEAVERRSLFPSAHRESPYSGFRLSDWKQTVVVPEVEVDYPLDISANATVDPSPSGAASGPSLEAAIRSGLLELVERDAVMVAWNRQARLERVDLAEHRGSSSMDRLLTSAEEQDADVVIARMATPIPGYSAFVGCVIGPAPASAVGAAISYSSLEGSCRALREALQVLCVLRGVHAAYGQVPPPHVVDDLTRAKYWTSEEANQSLREWVDAFVPPASNHTDGRPLTFAELANELERSAGPAFAVDLTPRLPIGAQRLGWYSAKVVCGGLQALRMTEANPKNLNAERMKAAQEQHPPGFFRRCADNLWMAPQPLI